MDQRDNSNLTLAQAEDLSVQPPAMEPPPHAEYPEGPEPDANLDPFAIPGSPTPEPPALEQRLAEADVAVASLARELGMDEKPPEHPETRALRHLITLSMLASHQAARACDELVSAHILDRYDVEARDAYDGARVLLRTLAKAYGMDYVPPQLPSRKMMTAE